MVVSLGDGNAPSLPYAGLIEDSEGNFYGTTEFGGANNQGTVFELSGSGSSWTATVLYSFAGGSDGAQPHGGLLFDSAGNLYGTTNFGGSANCSNGCGTVFKLTPESSSWSESVLYAFTGGSNGQEPNARLVLDSQGNLYGTTLLGGNAGTACTSGCGTVFQLSLSSSGWQQSVLYAFTGGKDGATPYAGPTLDSDGNLYGTTSAGGNFGSGTVFELTRGSSGSWTEKVLQAFSGGWGGKAPVGDVILDSSGNLYGTTSQGGARGSYGVVFELQPLWNGNYHETVLHAFYDAPAASPMAGLVRDSAGNLYGTTALGASLSTCDTGCGTLFKLAPSSGSWVFSVLHVFGQGTDGYNPTGDLIFDSNGDLWGTTQAGGSQKAGTVFQIVP